MDGEGLCGKVGQANLITSGAEPDKLSPLNGTNSIILFTLSFNFSH